MGRNCLCCLCFVHFKLYFCKDLLSSSWESLAVAWTVLFVHYAGWNLRSFNSVAARGIWRLFKKTTKKTKQPEENQHTEVLKIGHTRTSDRRQWSVKDVLTLSGSLYLFDFMFRIVFLLKLKGIPLLVPRAVDVEWAAHARQKKARSAKLFLPAVVGYVKLIHFFFFFLCVCVLNEAFRLN